MWPMLLDYSKEECKRILRKLELEAYSSIISALRAQGELTKEKKKLLQDLCSVLSIPTERHRAEIRRAVNDEKLYTIAEIIGGSGTNSDWAIEGRRLIPLLPRLVPQTAFSSNADAVASSALQHNSKLPPPHTTGQKRLKASSEAAKTSGAAVKNSPSPSKQCQPSNSQSNVVVFPPGMSVHIKDGVEPDTPAKNKKLKKSADQSPHHKPMQEISSNQLLPVNNTLSSSSGGTTRTVSIPIGANPMKITLSSPTNQKSSTTSTVAKSSASVNVSTQKVILVSTSGTSLPPSILQRSLSIPVVKTVSATKTTASTGVSKFSPSSVVASPSVSLSATAASKQSARPRTVTIPARGKSKQQSIVIPVGSTQQGSLKTVPGKSPMQVKQDSGAVKIITRTVPSGKLLPKSSSGVPQNITLSSGSSTARVVNVVTSQGGRTISPSSGDPSVVVVNAKALQSGAFKLGNAAASSMVRQAVNQVIAAGGSGNKPNVIVVKQSQLFPNSGNILSRVMYGGQKSPGSSSGSTNVKTVISASDQSLLKTLSASATESSKTKVHASNFAGDTKQSTSKPNTLLADLMEASGITYGNENIEVSSYSVNQQPSVGEKPNEPVSDSKRVNSSLKELGECAANNSWIEYEIAAENFPNCGVDNTQGLENPSRLNQDNLLHRQPITSSKSSAGPSQPFSLENVPECSVFELNSPEVTELINQSGSLSPDDSVKVLKQAGFEVNKVVALAPDTRVSKKVNAPQYPTRKTDEPSRGICDVLNASKILDSKGTKFVRPKLSSFSNVELRRVNSIPRNGNQLQSKTISTIIEADQHISSMSKKGAKMIDTSDRNEIVHVIESNAKSDKTASGSTKSVMNSKADEHSVVVECNSMPPIVLKTDVNQSSIPNQEHQAFLEEVVKELQKQEVISSKESKEHSSAFTESVVATSSSVGKTRPQVVGSCESANVDGLASVCNESEKVQTVVSSSLQGEAAHLDAFNLDLVDEMITKSYPNISSSDQIKEINETKEAKGIAAGSKCDRTFIRIQDLDHSKESKVKVHHLAPPEDCKQKLQVPFSLQVTKNTIQNSDPKSHSLVPMQMVGLQSKEETVESMIQQPVTSQSCDDLPSRSVSNSSDIQGVFSESNIVGNSSQNVDLASIPISNLFQATASLALNSFEQNFAITEVTKCVTSPMMASQVAQPSSESRVADNVIDTELANISIPVVGSNQVDSGIMSLPEASKYDAHLNHETVTAKAAEFPSKNNPVPKKSPLLERNCDFQVDSFGGELVSRGIAELDNETESYQREDAAKKCVQSSDPAESVGNFGSSNVERTSFVSSTSGKVSSNIVSSDLLAVSSTSCDSSAVKSKPFENSEASVDSTCDEVVTCDLESTTEIVDSTSIDQFASFQSVDSTSSSKSNSHADDAKPIVDNSNYKEESPVCVDSTSVLRQCLNLTASVDSTCSEEEALLADVSEVIDSTTAIIYQQTLNESSSDASNHLVDDMSIRPNADGSSHNYIDISATPRICAAPSNFMISNSKNESMMLSSENETAEIVERVSSNVMVEQEIIDTTSMKIEDFASQRIKQDEKLSRLSALSAIHQADCDIQPNPSSSSLPHQSIEPQNIYGQDSIQQSISESPDSMPEVPAKVKRKRKLSDAAFVPGLGYGSHVASWVRSAMGLVQRVSKFRGSCRSKSDQDAAHWFLSPVSEEDVPDYYRVIQQPMDFSTIKSKLEMGHYNNMQEFHQDMLLVKNNCETYNPPKHQARLDCEEVFEFYQSEYDKLMEKWQRSHIISSPKKSKNS